MRHTVFRTDEYVCFTFIPEGDEILDGAKSIYTDGLGRLTITVGLEKNQRKKAKIAKRSEKLRQQVMDAITVRKL